MEKILATLYLIGVFFTALIFASSYVIKAISRWARRNKTVENQPEPVSEHVFDIVGKSKSSPLLPLVFEKNEPVSATETEPDVSPEDIDVTMTKPYIPDDDELEQLRNFDVDIPEVFSQGLTYQQISQALEVVDGRKTGEDEELDAGETLSMMPSDLLNVICMQTDYEKMVEKLVSGFEKSVGNMKPKPVTVADFNIKNYV
jgi:hypothetical protein